jgi:superfamily II DNA or RNA helicase
MYQQDAVFLAINNRTSRIEIATSGGKTFITYIYCRYLLNNILESDKKILLIVPSQLLCTQLKRDFEHFDTFQNDKIIVETIFSGAKKVINAKVVCGTYQSLCKYDEDYFDDFSVMICDELHRAKAYSIRNEIYSKMNHCQYIFGMTGTFPEYKTLDYLHIVAMFGQEILKVSAKQLMDSGVVNPIKIEQIKIKYKDKDDNIIQNIYDLIIDNTLVSTEKYMAEKLYYQNNKERTNLVAKFINKFDENSIIFVNTVEYCENIYSYLKESCPDRRVAMIYGQTKKRDDILEEMRQTPNGFVLVCTMATMGTGISIKNLTNGYIVDSGKSETQIRQSLGRLMRILEDKPNSRLFDFYDDVYLSNFRKHAIARQKIYKDQKFPINTYNTIISK